MGRTHSRHTVYVEKKPTTDECIRAAQTKNDILKRELDSKIRATDDAYTSQQETFCREDKAFTAQMESLRNSVTGTLEEKAAQQRAAHLRLDECKANEELALQKCREKLVEFDSEIAGLEQEIADQQRQIDMSVEQIFNPQRDMLIAEIKKAMDDQAKAVEDVSRAAEAAIGIATTDRAAMAACYDLCTLLHKLPQTSIHGHESMVSATAHLQQLAQIMLQELSLMKGFMAVPHSDMDPASFRAYILEQAAIVETIPIIRQKATLPMRPFLAGQWEKFGVTDLWDQEGLDEFVAHFRKNEQEAVAKFVETFNDFAALVGPGEIWLGNMDKLKEDAAELRRVSSTKNPLTITA